MEKWPFMNYQEYVEAAKRLVNRIDCFQGKIAEYAMAVCQIRHGGRSDGYYTLTDFAEDVGITGKQLSRWVGIYRVSLSVGIKNPTTKDWTTLTKMKQIETMKISAENNSTNTPRKKIKPIVDSNSRKETFQRINNGSDKEWEFSKLFKLVQSNKNINSRIDLDAIDEKDIGLLMKYLDEMSDQLNDYLTTKKKNERRVS